MKSLFSCLLTILMLTTNSFAQSGGTSIASSEEVRLSYPIMVLSEASSNTPLPSVVKNNELVHMPPPFHQELSSMCLQVSETWYTYGYEINRLRDLSAGTQVGEAAYINNQYHPNYTYNFLNGGTPGNGTVDYSGFEILMEGGCPSYYVFDDVALDDEDTQYQYWMTDYDNYYNGMSNKVSGIERILWDDTYSSLDLLKHWVSDHNEGDATGGLAVFSVFRSGWHFFEFDPGEEEEGKHYLGWWGTGNRHSLTIVGYNDNVICFNINDDGEYLNEDMDGDGVIELQECERGAFLVANSEGEGWLDGGYAYVPYRMLASDKMTENIQEAHVGYVLDDYEPSLTMKVSIEHPERQRINLKLGYKEDCSSGSYTELLDNRHTFRHDGGEYPMRGVYEGPIEVGIDYGQQFMEKKIGKIYLLVFEDGWPQPTPGTINNFSIIDYRWGEEFELYCEDEDVTINNMVDTWLTIEYDLIPHESNITSDLSLFSNMVSRFMPTVDNNSTLTVEEDVRVDMYNSEIYIKSGSKLILEDDAVILAKRGNCKIVIDGDIDVGSGVIFEAEDGASLEVVINNVSHNTSLNNVTFRDVKLTNYGQNLSISNSLFEDCPILYSFRGNVTINNNTIFDKSHVYLADQTSNSSNKVIINNCDFTLQQFNPIYFPALEIWNYKNFSIEANEIDGYYCGIVISQSGGGLVGNEIINNEIQRLSASGILTFNTTATLRSNYIHDNGRGVSFTNNSNITIHGYSYYTDYDAINNIRDNSSYELYASELSFPWYFKYNAIVDDDNLGNSYGDPLVYYDTQLGAPLPSVTYNCWGSGFVYTDDLYPTTMPFYPTWCPGDGGGKSSEVALQSYQDGLEYFENENFEDAKSEFESIIELYPETQYASAAMKSLFNLEKFSDNDYATLQSYYETNDSIQADSLLTDLSVFLANRCEVEMENWQTAIDHYEDVIENTDDPQDSIFAIIDLGYTYLLMGDDDSRATVMGKMTEHIPNSIPSFIEKRDYLLSLLPIKKTKEHLSETSGINGNSDILKQNTPNPFSNSTTIYYDLANQSNVVFKVYDSKGSIVKTIDLSIQEKGLNNFELDMQQMPKGLYFYSIFTDGNLVGSKKMIVK